MRSIVVSVVVLLAVCLLSAAGYAEQASDNAAIGHATLTASPVYEIRNYHYDPAKLDAYKQWAINDAIPFFKAHMDVIGFWMGNDHPPRITGTKPMDLELGSANITWIIRWDSMEARSKFHKEVFGGEEWRTVWARHPDPAGYFQSEARFTTGY